MARVKRVACKFIFIFFCGLSYVNFFDIAFAKKNDKINDSWRHVDFDLSMGKGSSYYKSCLKNMGNFSMCVKPQKATEFFDLLKKLYNENNLSVKKSRPKIKIPKIIHQIWIGGEIPKKYKVLSESWIKCHPDWEYKLWTDEDLKDFDFYDKKVFDNGRDYAEKANILRYEILYKFGGLYVDTDFECFKSFDFLHENYEFYTGICTLDVQTLCLANGLIASVPGHPILKFCVENVKMRFNQGKVENRHGPVYFTRAFFTVMQHMISEEEYDNIIALPATYFYPVGSRKKNLKGQELFSFLKNFPEAFAHHHWAATWL